MQKKSLTWSAGGEGARLLINRPFSCFPCLWVYSSVFCFVWWYSLLQVHSLSIFVFPSGFLFSSGFRVQFPPVFPRSFRVPLSPSVLWFLPGSWPVRPLFFLFLVAHSLCFLAGFLPLCPCFQCLSPAFCWVPPPCSFSPCIISLLWGFFFLLCFLCFWVNFSGPFSPEILPWFWVFFSIL